MVKLTAIQMCSVPDVDANLAEISRQLLLLTESQEQAVDTTHLVVLPECCLFFGGKDSEQLTLAKANMPESGLIASLSDLAKRFNVYLVAGTIPIYCQETDKFTNSSCVFSPTGELLAQYDKIHLFDVEVEDSEKSYLESRFTKAGASVEVLETEFATIGLSVCFDVRFPILYQELAAKGARIITVPAAFTRVTGKAHWQTLLQARAIENQAYIIAAAQEGVHANGRETWGHSMIISPWGEVLACLEEGKGQVSSIYREEEVERIRQRMPLKSNLGKA